MHSTVECKKQTNKQTNKQQQHKLVDQEHGGRRTEDTLLSERSTPSNSDCIACVRGKATEASETWPGAGRAVGHLVDL